MKEVNEIFRKLIEANLSTVFSWGFYGYTINQTNIEFCVEGFKHNGTVRIEFNSLDLFDIILFDTNNKEVKIIRDVYVDALIETIDYEVERTDNYMEDIKAYYKL